MKRSQFGVLAAGFAASATRSARAQTAARLRIATIPIDNGAEPFYALDQGFFHAAGLDVEITSMTNGGAIVAAVAGGAVDIGFSNLFSFVTAYAKGVPVTIVAPASLYLSTSTVQVLTVLKDAPIHTGKDLDGKIVAVDGLKGITQITAAAWMDQHGGDSKTVQWIEMPMPTMPAALAQHRCDAAAGVIDVFPLGTPDAPDRRLAYPYDAIANRFLASGFIASKPWALAHPDLVKAFVSAIFATARWANAHHDQSGQTVMKVANLTPERFAAIAMYRAPYAETMTPALIEPVINFAAKYNIIDGPFAPQEAIDPAILH